jgi:hypothetical protein
MAAMAKRNLAEVILYWPPPLRPRARAEDAEHQLAFRGRRVDRRSVSGQHLEGKGSPISVHCVSPGLWLFRHKLALIHPSTS